MDAKISANLLEHNEEYAKFIKLKHNTNDDAVKTALFNIQNYAEFLSHALNGEILPQFVEDATLVLTNFSTNMFWLHSAKQSFNFLIQQIKKGEISLDSVQFFLPQEKMMTGFTLSTKEYIEERILDPKKEEKRLMRLAKEQQLDKIIMFLIQQHFNIISKEL